MKRSDTRVGLSADIHTDNIAQGEVVECKHTGTKEPDRKSNPLVNSQSVDKVENCKSSQEDTNKNNQDMNQGEMVEGIQPEANSQSVDKVEN